MHLCKRFYGKSYSQKRHTLGGTGVTCVYFYLSRAHGILSRAHEILKTCAWATKSWAQNN